MKRDLTKGNITKNLLYMAMPAIMGQMARTLYDIVDMFWIGKISSAAVAGVTIFTSILFLVWVLSSIIGTSSVSLISQSYGSGDKKRTAEVIEQTIVFKALVAFITMLFIFPMLKTFVSFLSTDSQVIKEALEYGYLRLMFLPIMFSSVTLSTALRCIGDSRKPMIIMLTSSILNIVLDPIFMFKEVPLLGIKGFGLGIRGAALATCIAGSVAFLIGFYFLISGKSNIKISLKGLLKLNPEIDRKLMLIGLPVGIEMLARESSGLIILKLISSFGTSVVAGVGITFRLMGLAFMMMVGIGDGAGTIVGQNLGANQVKRAEKTSKTAVKLGLMSTIIFFVVSLLFAPQIVGAFSNDADVVTQGASILKVLALCTCMVSITFGYGSAFSGSGYNKPFMYSSLMARWLVQIPWFWVTIKVLKLPFIYAIFGYLVADIAEAASISFFYYMGAWKHHRVVEKAA
jgi:MATE family, multidrug efflux pump